MSFDFQNKNHHDYFISSNNIRFSDCTRSYGYYMLKTIKHTSPHGDETLAPHSFEHLENAQILGCSQHLLLALYLK